MTEKEAGELIDKFYNILIDKYGEDFVDKTKKDNTFIFTIKYPKITITNSKNTTHNILDLYVFFRVFYNYLGDRNHKGLYLSSNISCERGVLTSIEYDKNYYHSHYPTYGNTTGNFCLGYSELGTFITESALSGLNEESFEFFTYLLDSYLAWESLEGGPYYRMNGLIKDDSIGEWGNFKELDINIENEIIDKILSENLLLIDISNYNLTLSNKTYSYTTPLIYDIKEIYSIVKEILWKHFTLNELIDLQYIYNIDTDAPFVKPFTYSTEHKVIKTFQSDKKFKSKYIEKQVIEYNKIYEDEFDENIILSTCAINDTIVDRVQKKLNKTLETAWQKQLQKLNQPYQS